MHKSNSLALTQEEIDEELVNEDLLKVGGVENDVHLQEMKLEEKKTLLRGIQQSKVEYSSQTDSRLLNKSSLEISATNFPSLPTAGKSNNNNGSRNKLKLPRRSIKSADSDDSLDKCISLLDDEEETFSLPFCTNDDAPGLPMPERLFKRVKNPYYMTKGETPAFALKRMLAHHDKWKASYTAEISSIESNALGEDIEEDTDIIDNRNSQINEKTEEKDCDPYSFVPDSPIFASKVYNEQRKRDTDSPVSTGQPASRQIQRKTSRDSDFEEVEPISKPEQPKLGEWIPATNTRHKSKRNKKQLINNQEKEKTFEGSPDVQFDFNNKWDSQSSAWRASQSPTSSTLNNQLSTRRSGSNNTIVKAMARSLEKLIKELEAVNIPVSSASLSSPSEDVSVREQLEALRSVTPERHSSPPSPIHVEELSLLSDKVMRCSHAVIKTLRNRDMEIVMLKRHSEVQLSKLKYELKLLDEIVSCSVCLERLRASVVCCVNGHAVCEGCRGKLTQCPTCRFAFSKEKFTVLSQLLEALPQYCKHSGCTQVNKRIQEHEHWCGFRHVQCRKCDWKQMVTGLQGHICSHQTNIIKVNSEKDWCLALDGSKNQSMYVTEHNQLFWLVQKYVPEEAKLVIELTWLPDGSIDHDMFEMKAEFEKDLRKFKLATNVHFDPSGDGVSARFVLQEMLQCFTENGSIKYKLFILLEKEMKNDPVQA